MVGGAAAAASWRGKPAQQHEPESVPEAMGSFVVSRLSSNPAKPLGTLH